MRQSKVRLPDILLQQGVLWCDLLISHTTWFDKTPPRGERLVNSIIQNFRGEKGCARAVAVRT